METNYAFASEEKSELVFKSSEMHAQRLKKLKQKLSFETPQISHYNQFREQSFVNTKFSISRSTNNILNPFDQTMSREQNQAPNKSNYFQSMNLKNIQSQNKILYKKIQRIVKRKSKNFIAQQRNSQRKSLKALQNYEEPNNNDCLNVTSDLAEDMIKNRATRSMLKQQQIRNQNISIFSLQKEMLHRLMTLKPTIETKKILNQTKRQKEISKRMSKFNSFHSIQPNKEEIQKYQRGESLNMPKKLSLDNPQKRNEANYEIPSSLIKRHHLFHYHGRTFSLLPESPSLYQRTKTQPIHSFENVKLPNLSPKNSTSLYSFQAMERTQNQLKKRARSQNLKSIQASKNLLNQKPDISIFYQRSNSTENVLEKGSSSKIELFKAQKALQKQKILSRSPIKEKSSQKFILLGQIEKKVQKLDLRFRFVRFSSYYEIQIGEKKQKNQEKKSETSVQVMNQSLAVTKLKQQTCKQSPQPESTSNKNFQVEKISKSQPNRQKIKFSGSIIFLDQQMGSALFSSLDYDYHQIVEKCLVFNIGRDGRLNVDLKEEFRECSRRMIGYQNSSSIRENDQAEEEDSMQSVKE